MQKKVGIVDKEDTFVKRFKDAISNRHEDVEVYYFPDIKTAQTAAEKFVLNVLLIDRCFVKDANTNLIPTASCKTVLLSNEQDEKDDFLPTICKYKSVEEWYEIICEFCRCEEDTFDQGGESGLSQNMNCPVCLILSGGEGDGATATSTAFCHFLKSNGFKRIAAFEPYLESGEDVWRLVERTTSHLNLLLLCQDSWDKDSVVIPFINSDFVILVTNGSSRSNNRIRNILKELPKITGISKKDALEKVGIIYYDFDPNEGTLFDSNEITKLGGIDTERNKKASFEKLVGILGVRRD